MLIENSILTSTAVDMFDDEILNYAKQLRYGDVHLKLDHATGLVAIIAIHNTKLGPSLGGCRLHEYSSIKEAFRDALRLAQGMSYKNAIAGLPLGGGKSVIIKPAKIQDREQFFKAFGRAIDELGGRYITSVDSGTGPTDMDAIAHSTRFVTSTSKQKGDPSPFTATGVCNAIRAAVKIKNNRHSLEGLHIAIQGVGHVGYYLARDLHQLGAHLTVADIKSEATQRCVEEFGANVVPPEQIHQVECDVFAPCALGAVINDKTIPQIQAKIIVGAANNQLAEPRHGVMLHQREILYGPDYVVNSGGVVHASSEYLKIPLEQVQQHVANIYGITLSVLERAAKENRPTSEVADIMAEEIIYSGE